MSARGCARNKRKITLVGVALQTRGARPRAAVIDIMGLKKNKFQFLIQILPYTLMYFFMIKNFLIYLITFFNHFNILD